MLSERLSITLLIYESISPFLAFSLRSEYSSIITMVFLFIAVMNAKASCRELKEEIAGRENAEAIEEENSSRFFSSVTLWNS